jgi:Iron-containing redox enzyme
MVAKMRAYRGFLPKDDFMEAWSFHRYLRPRLNIESLKREGENNVLTMVSGGDKYRIAFDDAASCDEFQRDLTALRDPEAEQWVAVRNSCPRSGWRALADFLDARSLIEDMGAQPDALLSKQQTDFEDRVRLCVGLVQARTRSTEVARQQSFVNAILGDLVNGVDLYSDDTFDIAIEPNFYVTLIRMELSYLRANAPPTFAAAMEVLTRLASVSRIGCQDEGGSFDDIGVGLFDMTDFNTHLDLVGHCLVGATADDADRFPVPRTEGTAPVSGLEFIRQAERITRAALEMWGSNRYVSALASVLDPSEPLAKGCFVEEYHVTRRFVEIIAPALHKRLSAPLRALMFRYYSEEVGHEAFERKTCEALGIDAESLDLSAPLPLSSGFVDCLTQLSEKSPLAFLASIMVTEGMLGDPSVVAERLSEVGRGNEGFREVSRVHDTLNQDLNHASIARLALECVGAVRKHAQGHALRRLMFILELNQRTWNQIADFYGSQKSFSPYRV